MTARAEAALGGSAERGPIRDLLCLPTASVLQIGGTETSVRRRFLGSASDKPLLAYICGGGDVEGKEQ